MTPRSILCPVDFSEHSQRALRWAIALAARHRGRVVVLTAVDPLLAEAARARYHTDLAGSETATALRAFVEPVVPRGAGWVPEIAFDVRVGHAPDVILEAVQRETVELIAMGTQGLGGVRKLLLGSTTECVLRQTRVPVLAVPPHADQAVTIDGSGAKLRVERIVVAADFSDTSTRALGWGVELARELSVPLVLTHVVAAVSVPAQWQPFTVESDDARVADARAKLQELSQQSCAGHPCEIVVSVGRPADAIAAAAEERHAGLIVMGLASEAGPLSRRPGSIAYRVLSLAAVPVVVVPPPFA